MPTLSAKSKFFTVDLFSGLEEVPHNQSRCRKSVMTPDNISLFLISLNYLLLHLYKRKIVNCLFVHGHRIRIVNYLF